MNEILNYSTSEKAKFFDALQTYNVSIQYESVDDLDAFLSEINPIFLSAHKRYCKKNSYQTLFYEHDLNLQKITGYSKFYRYYDLHLFDDDLRNMHKKIASSLLIAGSPGMDFTEWFSIDYDVNHKENRYVFSTHLPLHDLGEENIDPIFNNLSLHQTDFLYKFRRKAEYCTLTRLVYNNLWDLKSIAYNVDTNHFFNEKIIFEKYSQYKNFLVLLGDKIPTADFIDVLFKLNDDNYIGIEIGVSDVSYVSQLYGYDIINEDEKKYILNNKKTVNANHHTIRLEWNNSQNFQLKWYNSETK